MVEEILLNGFLHENAEGNIVLSSLRDSNSVSNTTRSLFDDFVAKVQENLYESDNDDLSEGTLDATGLDPDLEEEFTDSFEDAIESFIENDEKRVSTDLEVKSVLMEYYVSNREASLSRAVCSDIKNTLGGTLIMRADKDGGFGNSKTIDAFEIGGDDIESELYPYRGKFVNIVLRIPIN